MDNIQEEKFDRIFMTVEQATEVEKQLLNWLKDSALTKKVKSTDIEFDVEGVFNYIDKTGKILKKLYYNMAHPKGIELVDFIVDGQITYRIVVGYNGEVVEFDNILKERNKVLNFDDRYVKNGMKKALKDILNFMQYVGFKTYLKQKNPIVIKRANIQEKGAGDTTKNNVTQERKIVNLSEPKKTYDYENATREGKKKEYSRKTESWEVMGHWRHYKKSGKSIFVKSYKKGSKDSATKKKDYRM